MADVWFIVPTKFGLLHAEYEVKTGKGVLSKEQEQWKMLIENMGGLYVVVREDYHIAIDKTREYINEKENNCRDIKSVPKKLKK